MIAPFSIWACLFAAYILFAGELSSDEAVAGALCAVAGVLWWGGTRRVSAHSFAFDVAAWAAAGRACRNYPGATLSIAGVLFRALFYPVEGETDRWFYAHGRRADPSDGGRRAVGVLAASLTPDSFVLHTPPDRDEVIVHGLPRPTPSIDPRWPL